MGPKEFAEMLLGEERGLNSGPWQAIRPVYARAQAYVASVTPSPQFEFSRIKRNNTSEVERWVIRRIR